MERADPALRFFHGAQGEADGSLSDIDFRCDCFRGTTRPWHRAPDDTGTESYRYQATQDRPRGA